MSELAVMSAGAPVAEESLVSGEVLASPVAALSNQGEAVLSDSRRSMRKRLPRSPSLKGRRVKSCPKSPLMRMAELRKGGFRAGALRQSEGKGSVAPGLKKGKGRKGATAKEARELVEIPEHSVVGFGSVGGSSAFGSSGAGVAEGVPGAVFGMVGSGDGEVLAGDGVDEVGGDVVVFEAELNGLVAGAVESVVGIGVPGCMEIEGVADGGSGEGLQGAGSSMVAAVEGAS